MGEEKNEVSRREIAEKEIEDRINRERIFEMAEAGKQDYIRMAFKMSPEDGGYSDLLEDDEAFQEVLSGVDERLQRGAENTWWTYSDVAREVRKKHYPQSITPRDEAEENYGKDLRGLRDQYGV